VSQSQNCALAVTLHGSRAFSGVQMRFGILFQSVRMAEAPRLWPLRLLETVSVTWEKASQPWYYLCKEHTAVKETVEFMSSIIWTAQGCPGHFKCHDPLDLSYHLEMCGPSLGLESYLPAHRDKYPSTSEKPGNTCAHANWTELPMFVSFSNYFKAKASDH